MNLSGERMMDMAYEPLDPEFKQQWIDALLSGDYEQGRGELRTIVGPDKPDQFCCLGVGCQISDPEGWVYDERHGDIVNWHYCPNTEIEELGWIDYDAAQLLSGMNDGDANSCGEVVNRKSFPEIAEWIRVNL